MACRPRDASQSKRKVRQGQMRARQLVPYTMGFDFSCKRQITDGRTSMSRWSRPASSLACRGGCWRRSRWARTCMRSCDTCETPTTAAYLKTSTPCTRHAMPCRQSSGQPRCCVQPHRPRQRLECAVQRMEAHVGLGVHAGLDPTGQVMAAGLQEGWHLQAVHSAAFVAEAQR